MEFREIKNTKIKASVIGLGTWAIGGGSWWGATDRYTKYALRC